MVVHFVVLKPNGDGKKFKLKDNEYVIIGRSEKSCQVVLDDDICSSQHCKISVKGVNVVLEDLKSKNGVYLNGVRILKQNIYINDKVKVGNSTIYINPNRMDERTITHFTHTKKNQARKIGEVTLELDNIKVHNTGHITQPSISRGDIQQTPPKRTKQKAPVSRQAANIVVRNRNTKPSISRNKLNLLISLASLIDFILVLGIFSLGVYLMISFNPEAQKLAKNNSTLQLIFHPDFLVNSGILAAVGAAFHFINKKQKKGSFGRQASQLDKYEY